MNVLEKFNLTDRVVVITGGGGFLGRKWAEAVLEAGGRAVLLDINQQYLDEAIKSLASVFPGKVLGFVADITSRTHLEEIREKVVEKFGRIDALINNAANNPKMSGKDAEDASRFETFPESLWDADLNAGLKGAWVASQIFGLYMAQQGKGVIVNVSSDLGLIGPDQRIYKKDGVSEKQQPTKPVTYSVVKHGLNGLTRYLATYWAQSGVRVNSVCPGGVYNGQDEQFMKKLTNLIPLGRMAESDEYKATIVYLLSDASSYMTGSIVSVDGGRTAW
jgi:NAD(P)-dependent dehydrogenase (short-subunit alcohol dehydrogenase family)